MINLGVIGDECLKAFKTSSQFPYKSGKLKNEATSGYLMNDNTYCIQIDGDKAPYAAFLEYGTEPHDIPFAFVGKGNWVWWYPYNDGVPFLFGMGGRFNGKFHPGSHKHEHFIEKCGTTIANMLIKKYGAYKWSIDYDNN